MRVVVLDSGVDSMHPELKAQSFEGVTFYSDEGVIRRIDDEAKDHSGHGTAINAIIRRVVPDVQIINVKIIEDAGVQVDEQLLHAALEHILAHIPCDLLNISLGICVSEDLATLHELICAIGKRGTIMVSAFDNGGAFSYPAAFPEVIGVTMGERCYKKDEFEYIEDDVVNIGAYGRVQRLAWVAEKGYAYLGGNSFAAAHVSAKVIQMLMGEARSLKDVLTAFKSQAKYAREYPVDHPVKGLPAIEKAAIFPFNKEMHSLIRFADLLRCEICDVYDIRESGRVRGYTSKLLGITGEHVPSFQIKNIQHIDWDSIDTLILGHTAELLSTVSHQSLILELLNTANEKGKNIVCFDDVARLLKTDVSAMPNVYYPSIEKKHLPPYRYGKLYAQGKPVIGVFGTSSKQGKFTLQLGMRRSLISMGYTVGQLGTEPQSLLFGMDAVFPMGYHSTVYVDDVEAVRMLNSMMNDIAQKDCDVIIVGSQSLTLPYCHSNMDTIPIMQHAFLTATLPDIVVLCVNAHDEITFIQRTIRYIEAVGISKVACLMLFPVTMKDNWSGILGGTRVLDDDELRLVKDRLSGALELPVMILGQRGSVDTCVSLCIDHLSNP